MTIQTSSTTEYNITDTYPFAPKMAEEALAKALARVRFYQQMYRFAKYREKPVEFVEEVLGDKLTPECEEIMLSVRDNPITVVKSANGVGKTFTSARVAFWYFFSRPLSQIYLAAAPPLENLDSLAWGEVNDVVQRKKALFANLAVRYHVIGQGKRKWWIKGVAIPTTGTEHDREAKFSGKHAPDLLFIFDEGDAIPDEVYRGADSCMSSDGARMLIMLNPRAQVGSVWRKIRDKKANVITVTAFSHPNVVSGENKIPGAVSRNVTIQRIQEWTRPLVEDEPHHENDIFAVPFYLEKAVGIAPDGSQYPPLELGVRKIIQPEFCYKVLGEYPFEGETQLINSEWLEAARTRWDRWVDEHGETPPTGVPPTLGGDIAEFGADSNVAQLRYGGWVPKPHTWIGVDVDETSTRFVDIYLKNDCERAIIDGTGIGSSVAPSMVRKGRARGKTVRAYGIKASESPTPGSKTEFGEFWFVRDQLWWAMRMWLKNDWSAMLPPDEKLLEELRAPTYHINVRNSKLTITDKDTLRKQLLRSPDRAEALCLTFMPVARAKVVRAVGE